MRVLASRRFPGPAWDALEDVGVEWPSQASDPGVEVLAVVAATVDEALLELLPDLRLVANYGVGYDGIDVEACARRGVAVTNTPEALGIATADLTMALVLATRRRLVEGDRFVREGKWASGWVVGELLGDEIGGATLGIVGLGRIGSAVATPRAGVRDERAPHAPRGRREPGSPRARRSAPRVRRRHDPRPAHRRDATGCSTPGDSRCSGTAPA